MAVKMEREKETQKYTQTLFHSDFVEIISSPHKGVIRGVFL